MCEVIWLARQPPLECAYSWTQSRRAGFLLRIRVYRTIVYRTMCSHSCSLGVEEDACVKSFLQS